MRKITAYLMRKKIRYTTLSRAIKRSPEKLLKMQALIRGHLTRVRNAAAVNHIKKNSIKNTKSYKSAARI